MSKITFLIPLLFCFGIIGASAFYSPSGDVVNLTPANFREEVLNSDDAWLVEFYAPWCGHCKQLKPTWEAAAKKLKGFVKVGAVNCDEHKELAQMYGIQGFPTIKAFHAESIANPYNKGAPVKTPVDYQYGRDLGSIVKFGNGLVPDYIRVLTTATEFETWATSFPKRVKGLLFTDKPTPTALYKSVAKAFKDRALFAMISPSVETVKKQFQFDTTPALFLIKSEVDKEGNMDVVGGKYEGPLKRDVIIQFFETEVKDEKEKGASVAAKKGYRSVEEQENLEKQKQKETAPKKEKKEDKKKAEFIDQIEKYQEIVIRRDAVTIVGVVNGNPSTKTVEFFDQIKRSVDPMVNCVMIPQSLFADLKHEKLVRLSNKLDEKEVEEGEVVGVYRASFDSGSKDGVVFNGKIEERKNIEKFGLLGIPATFVKPLSTANVEFILNNFQDRTPKIVLFTKSPGKPLFKYISTQFHSNYHFFEASADDIPLVGRFNVKSFPSLFLLMLDPKSTNEDLEEELSQKGHIPHQMIPFQGAISRENIVAWLSYVKMLVSETKQNDQGMNDTPQNKGEAKEVVEINNAQVLEKQCENTCVILMVDHMDDSSQQWIDSLKESTKYFSSDKKATFSWLDAPSHFDFAEKLGLGTGLPSLVTVNPKKGRIYRFVGQFESEVIRKWIDTSLRGRGRSEKIDTKVFKAFH